MSDLYYNIIIIILVLVLFLAYILIAYFYTSYSNYKEDVDDNFKKTKDYLNSNISKIDNNIRSSIDDNNLKIRNTSNYISDINTKVNRFNLKVDDNYNENISKINLINSNINFTNSNINFTNSKITSNEININKFDTNLKQFFQYKNNSSTINDAIFNYQFTSVPNLSLDLLRNVNAISGMTVETDSVNNFRLCDKNSNCMDMNINNQGFNIFPTNTTTNNASNIYFYDKTKQNIIAKFDLANKGIYLGGDGENASMYIKDSNVFIKNINILNNDAKFADTKVYYDKINRGQTQTYNTYLFDTNDINKNTQITGVYSITRGTGTPPVANILIINFKSSNNIISGKQLTFNILELNNTIMTDTQITSIETTPQSIISTAVINGNNIKITTSADLSKDTNYRIKLTSDKFQISTNITEQTIINIINNNI